MKPTIAALLYLLLLLGLPTQAAELPPQWQAVWDSPAATDRPLQIVHGIDVTGKLPEGLVVNVGNQAYDGRLQTETRGSWIALDLVTGNVTAPSVAADGFLPVGLSAHQSRLFVQTPEDGR